MKRYFLVIMMVILSISLFGCMNQVSNDTPQETDESNNEAVRVLVEEFGKKLQAVSLLAPKDILNKSFVDNYGSFVALELLAKWQENPTTAPGRLTSSPWPERIEIQSVEKISGIKYEVNGEIIELVNAGEKQVEVAATQAITLVVEKADKKWLISDVKLGPYNKISTVVYTNDQFGFRFSLPESWKSFSIVTDKWEGIASSSQGDEAQKDVVTGPMISIRHPQWSSEKPRQDIPIMIFTLNQWNMLQKEEFHIGAAPIGPSELGRNKEYVFALPARYNYAFPTGYEEVEEILKGNPLQAID